MCRALVLLVAVAAGCGDDQIVSVPAAEASQVNGVGSCASLSLPTQCLRATSEEFEAFCMVGPGSQISMRPDADATFPDGCVGALAVLRPETTANIDDSKRFGLWVASGRCDRATTTLPNSTCFPEQEPGNARPTVVSWHPKARALFVRSAEPITGPAQVSGFIASFRSLPDGVSAAGWMYRMVISAPDRD